jgi:hypothetical protein
MGTAVEGVDEVVGVGTDGSGVGVGVSAAVVGSTSWVGSLPPQPATSNMSTGSSRISPTDFSFIPVPPGCTQSPMGLLVGEYLYDVANAAT